MCFVSVVRSEDLLAEILLDFPVKSLTRFKCVSKQWLAIISSPYFVRRYLTSHCFPSLLLSLTPAHLALKIIFPFTSSHADASPSMVNFDFLKILDSILHVRQSCIGLLNRNRFQSLFPYYFVCNPTTKRFFHILGPRISKLFHSDCVIRLFFILIRIFILYMRLLYIPPRQVVRVKQRFISILVLQWRLTWKRCLLQWCYTLYNVAEKSLYFDLENQCFKTYPMPQEIQSSAQCVEYFGESQWHLHLILQTRDDSCLIFSS